MSEHDELLAGIEARRTLRGFYMPEDFTDMQAALQSLQAQLDAERGAREDENAYWNERALTAETRADVESNARKKMDARWQVQFDRAESTERRLAEVEQRAADAHDLALEEAAHTASCYGADGAVTAAIRSLIGHPERVQGILADAERWRKQRQLGIPVQDEHGFWLVRIGQACDNAIDAAIKESAAQEQDE